MTDLIEKKCVPCEGGMPALDLSEIHKYQKKVCNKYMTSKIKKAGDFLLFWSGSRESNPPPNRWQRFALPMS